MKNFLRSVGKRAGAFLARECTRRAMRTFFQSAAGYVAANLAAYMGGMEFTDATAMRSAILGVCASGIAAGIAAAMNLECRDGGDKGNDGGSGDKAI